VIMDIGNGTCVLDHFEDGCLKVYWYLPTHCVDHAYHSAILKCHKFSELSLTYLQIGSFPAIYDPFTTQATLTSITEPKLPANVGKVYILSLGISNATVQITQGLTRILLGALLAVFLVARCRV